MAIRDYWVYQKRDAPSLWAIYIVKEFDKRKLDSTVLDFTLYSEDIQNATHSKSFVGLHYDSVTGYVDRILAEISDFAAIEAADKDQLEKSITDILIH